MKYFLLIIFLAPMASLAQIQSANSHLIAWGIHGKVKQLTEYYYEKDQAYKDRHPTAKVVNNFDIAGRELEEVRTDDKKIYKTVYHYAKQRVYDTTYLNGSVSQTELEILDSTGRLSEWDFEINSPEMPKLLSNMIKWAGKSKLMITMRARLSQNKRFYTIIKIKRQKKTI